MIGGCADLCGKLANKTHSEAAAIACNALCDLVGLRTFIAMLNKYVHALPPLLPSISLIHSVCLSLCLLLPSLSLTRADLDPIYYCELLNVCPIKDDGDAKITSLVVKPSIVPYGETTLVYKPPSVLASISSPYR